VAGIKLRRRDYIFTSVMG